MIAFTITALLAFTLLSFLALARAFKHAPEGYEDETGFHHGITPRPVLATVHHFHETKHAA
jgi:hypothetical protein